MVFSTIASQSRSQSNFQYNFQLHFRAVQFNLILILIESYFCRPHYYRGNMNGLQEIYQTVKEAEEAQLAKEQNANIKFQVNLMLAIEAKKVKQAERKLRLYVRNLHRKGVGEALTSSIWGTVTPCKVTNSRWLQEGVSGIHSKSGFEIALDKKQQILISFEALTEELRKELGYPVNPHADRPGVAKAIQRLWGKVEEEGLKPLVGKFFRKGSEIFSGFGVTLRQQWCNQTLKLNGFEFKEAPFNEGGFFVTLKYSLIAPRLEKKLRGRGLKSTLVPLDILEYQIIQGKADGWVILHSMSGLKGKAWALEAFGNAYPGALLDLERQTIQVEGKTFNLNKGDTPDTWVPSIIQKWINKGSETEIHRFVYSSTEWQFIRECDEAEWPIVRAKKLAVEGVDIGEYSVGNPFYDVIDLEEIDEATVRLTVKVEVLHCDLPVNIEISLPEESSSKSALTPEMVGVMALVAPTIAEAMVDGERFELQRKGVASCTNMGLNLIPQKAKPGVVNFPGNGLEGVECLDINDDVLLRQLEARYPNGVVFFLNAADYQYVNFGAVGRLATFLGGNADGVSRDITIFLRWVIRTYGTEEFVKTIGGRYKLFMKGLRGFLKKQLESKKLRKQLVTPPKGSLLMAKVRTVALPELSHKGKLGVDAIPKVAMNPHDDLLREMAKHPDTGKISEDFLDETGKFDPQLMQGVIVSIGRIPMVMPGFCELVLTEKAAPGHMYTLMFVWAMLNEGDSDGDGIGLTPVFHYGADREMALAVNKTVMSFGGYAAIYGNDRTQWPCAEFCSWADSITKKALSVEPGTCASQKQLGAKILPIVRPADLAETYQNTDDVRQHYISAVSTSYNLCVIATNMAIQDRYLGVKNSVWERVANTAWRGCYEGNGLSGFSKGAYQFFTLLRSTGWMTHAKWDIDGNLTPIKSTKVEDTLFQQLKTAMGVDLSDDVVAGLIEAQAILQMIKDLRNPTKSYAVNKRIKANSGLIEVATRMGVLRSISQGTEQILEGRQSQGDEEYSSFEEDGEKNEALSLIELFLKSEGWKAIACPWQAKAAQTAARVTFLTLGGKTV